MKKISNFRKKGSSLILASLIVGSGSIIISQSETHVASASSYTVLHLG